MADIELVIKIDEEVYKKAKETHDVMCDSVWLGIKYGIPLPKGHGRLISEEDMLSVIMFSKLFDGAKVGEVKEALSNIPTIIEAEGSDSE